MWAASAGLEVDRSNGGEEHGAGPASRFAMGAGKV